MLERLLGLNVLESMTKLCICRPHINQVGLHFGLSQCGLRIGLAWVVGMPRYLL